MTRLVDLNISSAAQVGALDISRMVRDGASASPHREAGERQTSP